MQTPPKNGIQYIPSCEHAYSYVVIRSSSFAQYQKASFSQPRHQKWQILMHFQSSFASDADALVISLGNTRSVFETFFLVNLVCNFVLSFLSPSLLLST